jgi:hypothetical protein
VNRFINTEMADSSATNNVWGGWLNQAKEFAEKAKQMAEVGAKMAQERAAILAEKAVEMRQNYDMEVATSVLMNTMGSPALNRDSTPQKNKNVNKELDLIYVTQNIIAMAHPVDPKSPSSSSGEGGNDINMVASFLHKRHPGKFMIWNISEEVYDYSKFEDQVLEYKFPGHPAPPLGLLFKICSSIESWLDADDDNVAVVHCLTGKGRTAAMIACVLTWIGEFTSPMESLQYIADRRKMTVENLTIPSQRRYVQYFSNMLDGVRPRAEPLLLRRIIINSIPVFGTLGEDHPNSEGCCPYLQLFKNGKLIATAAPCSLSDGTHSDQANKPSLRWINAEEGSMSFTVDVPIQGDVLLRCRHVSATGVRVSMFRAGFHTGYVPSGVLRLTKAQLDGSNTDLRFDDKFFIDLIFATADSKQAEESTLTDASVSTDKYEATIHKDTRFWDTISARKNKSRKRKSRKFVSSQQEKFSLLGDEPSASPSSSSFVDSLSFLARASATSDTHASSASGLADMDLIKQLASAEDSDPEDAGGPDMDMSSDWVSPPTTDAVAATDTDTDADADADVGTSSGVHDGNYTEMGERGEGSAAADAQVVVVDHVNTTHSNGISSNGSSSSSDNTSSSSSSSSAETSKSELQALADLEKELGLSDLNLFTGDSSPEYRSKSALESGSDGSGSGSGTTPKGGVNDDDSENYEDLDELEQYLQSLSSS